MRPKHRKIRTEWLLLAGLLALPAAAETWTLDAEAWARPRSGAMVAGLEPVRAAVAAWAAEPERRLVIRHAGGEAGTLWAVELRDWLVALGVPPDRVETRPGAEPYRLALELQ